MPVYQPKVPVCVAIGCSAVALVCQFVAMVGTGWMKMLGSSQYGLFCTSDICNFGTGDGGWIKACQAFSILALLTITASLVLGVVPIFKEDTQKLTLLARFCSLAAAGCVAVEVGVFLGKTVGDVIQLYPLQFYGYCFFLSIVVGILMVVTSILHKPEAT
ncbi:uncharacterized protein LOC112562543 [Pomacea canaliculata]|uniref:uncharacterized protein LOC112562543 n=1 Tax=Pomacea canaliculata TaxID=400727 RepID=UPI000D73865F|nr:uncharacterized protein LOC112562543 [Pomacea canaliculata]